MAKNAVAPAKEPAQKINLPTLAHVANGNLAPQSEAVNAFLAEVKGPRTEPDSLPIVSIRHDDGMFLMPSGELVDTIRGYPIYYFQTRRYYKKAYSAKDQASPPDCWSADMVKPVNSSLEKQCETCIECPNARFGSSRDGRSQACSAQTWIFLLNPDFGTIPVVALVAPPSSIKAWMGNKFKPGYFGQARSKYGCYELVFTEVVLEKGGDKHYVCVPKMMGMCHDGSEAKLVAGFRNKFVELMESMRGKTPDILPTVENS